MVSDGEFLRKEEAINYWMCDECNYVFEVETPPET
jgi:rubrerythrin